LSNNLISRYVKRNYLYCTVLLLQLIFFIVFTQSHNLYAACVNFCLLGFFCGLLDVTLNTIVIDLFKESAGSSLNLMHMFFGFGAFLGSAISSQVVGRGLSWAISFYIVAGLIFFNFAISLFLKIPESDNYMQRNQLKTDKEYRIRDISLKNKLSVFTIVILLMLLLTQFSSSVTLQGFSFWMPTFLRIERDSSGILAGQILSLYWAVIGIGRLIVGIVSRKIRLEKILLLLSSFCFVFAVISIAINNNVISYSSFLIMGAFHSGIFPSMLALGSIFFTKKRIWLFLL